MRISDWSSDVCSSDLVPGVEDISNPKTVLPGHFVHSAQHLGQAAAGNRAVHAIVVRRQPPHSREGRLSSRPEGQALLLIIGDTGRHNVIIARNPGAFLDQIVALGRRRSEEHTSELQSLMRISYAVFGLK